MLYHNILYYTIDSTGAGLLNFTSMSFLVMATSTYIYVYMYIYIEREREIQREREIEIKEREREILRGWRNTVRLGDPG